ncbi:MAG: hypothetical protein HW407_2020 [Bacteroidetes bacterium]|nr:hypothetical protein [Bacteroidota bacterium]
MNSTLGPFSISRLLLIGVLLLNLCGLSLDIQAADTPTPATTVEGQKAGIDDAGKVEERGLSRAPMPGRMAPGGKVLTPGATFSALTKAECTGLGCKAVTDNACPDVGALRERCICKAGTKGVCIDAVK